MLTIVSRRKLMWLGVGCENGLSGLGMVHCLHPCKWYYGIGGSSRYVGGDDVVTTQKS